MRTKKNFSKPRNLVFSFVIDGQCELWYLQLLKECENLNTRSIHLEPKLPQKKKLKDQFNLAIELSEESEKVFWIIDFDTVLKETRESKKEKKTPLRELKELYDKCKKNGKIIIIVNNPCLEYWFLQHFEQTSKCYATFAELERPLKKHLPSYEKTEKYFKNPRQNIYMELRSYLPIAVNNAKSLEKFDFTNNQTGITEMYKIINELKILEQ